MFGYFSKSVSRDPDMSQNPYFVYDITVMEWENRKVLESDGKIYFCLKSSKESVYEVICKRDLCYIVVLFTFDNRQTAHTIYETCKRVINQLEKSVPWLHKTTIISIYKDIMGAVQANQNWSATHIAARVGLDVHFNNIDSKDLINQQIAPDKMTPLHLAIQFGNLNIVRAIIDYGPNLTLKDNNGLNPLHFAAISSPEILFFIFSVPGITDLIKVRNNKGCTPMHLACYSNKLENVFIFLRIGLPISVLSVLPPTDADLNQSANQITINPETDPIVRFSDREIDDFDVDFIPNGGTPLHWSRRQSQVERFIQFGFDINAPNLKGDTALILKAKKLRFKCLMSLLYQGADVNKSNSAGNTALWYAVKQGDITLTQALVVFDSEIDHTNRSKKSIRHLASTLQLSDNNYKMVLYVLSSLGAKRCSPNMSGCNDGCSHDGIFDGKRFIRWPLFASDKFYSNLQLKEVTKRAKANLSNLDKSKLVNMVSFDGGGIKGLITIQMIHELQKKLKHNFIEYFDWISGTSTGSIISTGLIMGRTATDIRSIYFRFKDKVMNGTRPYNSDLIETLLQEEISRDLKMGDLHTKYNKFAMIPATLIDRQPVQLHLFRSYPTPEMMLGTNKSKQTDEQFTPLSDHTEQLLWRAIRASCAAPTYFASTGQFIDGGLVSNNPTMDMIVEFNNHNYALKKLGRTDEIKSINAILSFGTGQIVSKPFVLPDMSKFLSWNPLEITNNVSYVKDMFGIIIDSACNCDFQVVDRCESWCATIGAPLFRINPKFIELFALNETQDTEIVNSLWLTKVFMYSKKSAIDEVIKFLESSWKGEPKKEQTSTQSKEQSSLSQRETTSKAGTEQQTVKQSELHKFEQFSEPQLIKSTAIAKNVELMKLEKEPKSESGSIKVVPSSLAEAPPSNPQPPLSLVVLSNTPSKEEDSIKEEKSTSTSSKMFKPEPEPEPNNNDSIQQTAASALQHEVTSSAQQSSTVPPVPKPPPPPEYNKNNMTPEELINKINSFCSQVSNNKKSLEESGKSQCLSQCPSSESVSTSYFSLNNQSAKNKNCKQAPPLPPPAAAKQPNTEKATSPQTPPQTPKSP